MKRWTGTAVAVATLAAGTLATTDAQVVEAVADEFWAAFVSENPEFALLAGAEADLGSLSSGTLESIRSWQGRIDGWRGRLDAVDEDELSGPSAVTYAYLDATLDNEIAQRVCRGHLWQGVNHLSGYQRGLFQVLDAQPVDSPEQRAAALRRFSQVDRRLLETVEVLRLGIAEGITQNRVAVERTIQQLDQMIRAPAEQSVLFGPARRSGDSAFEATWAQMVDEDLRPGLARYRDFLRDEYLPHARARVGVSELPNGAACYEAMIRSYTHLDVDAESVHETGLREIERIRNAMGDIAEEAVGTRDFRVLGQRLQSDASLRFENGDAALEFARDLVDRTERAMPEWFPTLAESPLEIRPVPEFQQATSPGGYYTPPPADGSRPGVYFLNTGQPQSRVNLEALTFHEAIPGHHWQLALAVERDAHPMTRYFGSTAFVEGWGLYAESLALEAGLYSSDATRFGQLGSELFRALRLVLDTGLHARGWTREQAMAFAQETMGTPLAGEIDRYIAFPAQANAYMLGKLEIMRLRRRAEEMLGPDFDIRTFHGVLLEDGTVPFPFVRAKVERWLGADETLEDDRGS